MSELYLSNCAKLDFVEEQDAISKAKKYLDDMCSKISRLENIVKVLQLRLSQYEMPCGERIIQYANSTVKSCRKVPDYSPVWFGEPCCDNCEHRIYKEVPSDE